MAVCHFIPSVCVCVCVCLVFLTECNLVKMTRFHSLRNTRHTQTERNDIRPQTARFYNERMSTDPILVPWQSKVTETFGFKKRPKHVGASF
jgi:hypothetical protein